jgi:HlyD family secretion protein
MDRRLPKRRPSPIKAIGATLLVAAAAAAVQQLVRTSGVRPYAVAANRVTISTVTSGSFEDFIPIHGSVTPLTIVYLDAIGRAS